MKKIPKPTLIQERDFPFESSISYGVENGFHELHWHKETEICYIKSGTGKYLINGTDYSFSAGDIFIIGNNDIHLCYDDKKLVMQVVMFDPFLISSRTSNSSDIEYLRLFSDNSYTECRKIEHSTECARLLSDILAEIEAEYDSEQKGYEMMIRSLLLRFFAFVFRNNPDKPDSGKNLSANSAAKVRSILQYIDLNYYEHIDLALLEQKFGISRPYLCRIFKTMTGISPIDYIIRKRIDEAKRRLIETAGSILEISEECGFNSLSNFNSLFKRMTGCTPGNYRKNGAAKVQI